jgi:beta-galactosidase
LRLLSDTLHETIPYAVVLHDFSGGFFQKRFDFFARRRNAREAAYNNYPVWAASAGRSSPLASRSTSTCPFAQGEELHRHRAIMGAQGHDVIVYLPRPNQANLWPCRPWRTAATVLFFRYRGYTKGAEQFCFGILDAGQ